MKHTRMVFTRLLIILAVTIGATNAAAVTKLKLFIYAGQSNAAGIAWHGTQLLPPDLQQPQKNVKFYYAFKQGNVSGWTDLRPGVGTELGCEECDVGGYPTFGRDLAAALPNDSLGIYLMADGGTTLAKEWRPPSSGGTTGSNYLDLVNQCKGAIAALGPNYQVEITGMVWMQGESDSWDAAAAAEYKVNLTNLIHDVRAEFNVPQMPFVMGMVDTVAMWAWNSATVRKAESDVAAAIPYVGIIDPKGYPKTNGDEGVGADGQGSVPSAGDPGHYNPFASMIYGSDLASCMMRQLRSPALGAFVEPSDLVVATPANGQVQLTWRDNSSTETGFAVERKTGAGAFAQIGTAGAGAGLFATYVDNTVSASTQYTYRVKAVNGAISSACTNEALVFPFGTGKGLKAEYYVDTTFSSLAFTRTDTTISFNWNGRSPGAGIPAGSKFSVRWTGYVQPKFTETYSFFVHSDQFGSVWVNSQLVVDPTTYLYRWGGGDPNWDKTTPTHCGSIRLTAGQEYQIKVEYHPYQWQNGEWPPFIYLSWKTSTSQSMQPIPMSQLYETAHATVAHQALEPRMRRSDMLSVVSTNRGASLSLARLSAEEASTVVVSDARGRAVRVASAKGESTIDLAAVGRGVYVISVNKQGRAAAGTFVIQR